MQQFLQQNDSFRQAPGVNSGSQPPVARRLPPTINQIHPPTPLLLVGLGVGYWQLRPGARGTAAPAGADPHDIAVLYFEDQSPKQDLGHVADGLTEGLISALGSVQGLSVVSKGGVGLYRGGGVARDSIARALQVGTLVMGSIEPEQDSIRVTIRILDDAGTELGKATFKQPGNDLIALSDSLTQEVAVLIRRRVGTEAQLRKTRLETQSSEAWAMYQRALLARRRGDSRAGLAAHPVRWRGRRP